MGPLPYNEALTFEANHRQLVMDLIRRLNRMTRQETHEGVFSSHIARVISEIAADIDKSLQVIHQLYSPGKTSAHVSIALLDSVTDAIHAHSLLEIKWTHDQNDFPEIEVTAFAGLLWANDPSILPWTPVFVLSKTHLRIGVAFDGILDSRAYSEIFSYLNLNLFDSGEQHFLMLLRFTRFLIQAADFHRKYKGPVGLPLNLVDSSGMELIRVEGILGFRVLLGSADEKEKIVKFYSKHEKAQ